jgi:hypothetical protein
MEFQLLIITTLILVLKVVKLLNKFTLTPQSKDKVLLMITLLPLLMMEFPLFTNTAIPLLKYQPPQLLLNQLITPKQLPPLKMEFPQLKPLPKQLIQSQ